MNVLAMLLLGGGAFLAVRAYRAGDGKDVVFNRGTEPVAVKLPIPAKDADGDGLKDWEEALWGTDPGNSDTDGDGTGDGAEIAARRDPLAKGPGDTLPPQEITALGEEAEKIRASASSSPQTLTELLALELYTNYTAQLEREGGDTLNAESRQVVTSILSTDTRLNPGRPVDRYTIADIVIGGEDGFDAVVAYWDETFTLILEHAKQYPDNEIEIFREAALKRNQDILVKLDSVVAAYRQLVALLLPRKVPQSAALIHLKLVNTYDHMADAIVKMRKLYDDPLLAAQGMGEYQLGLETLNAVSAQVEELLVRLAPPLQE